MYIFIMIISIVFLHLLRLNSLLLSPVLTTSLFSSSTLHFLFDFPAPSIWIHAGGESAVPTEQHRCSWQRHVSAFCQPSDCVTVRGWNLGQEAPAQNRARPQAHVQGKCSPVRTKTNMFFWKKKLEKLTEKSIFDTTKDVDCAYCYNMKPKSKHTILLYKLKAFYI